MRRRTSSGTEPCTSSRLATAAVTARSSGEAGATGWTGAVPVGSDRSVIGQPFRWGAVLACGHGSPGEDHGRGADGVGAADTHRPSRPGGHAARRGRIRSAGGGEPGDTWSRPGGTGRRADVVPAAGRGSRPPLFPIAVVSTRGPVPRRDRHTAGGERLPVPAAGGLRTLVGSCWSRELTGSRASPAGQ